jgi:filamentous hemagglutinin family protein
MPAQAGEFARRLAIVLCAAVTLSPVVAGAQHITVDGSLSRTQTLIGPNYTIGANLGRQLGGNLFQSFGQFGLSNGETATFSGPATVSNIISRVTGGAPSSINGAVQSTISGANLYMVNPAGIVFGPNGTVNVSGSFHAATADYIRMSDGTRFQATNPGGSTLSAAAPAAFGFLNARPATITMNGATLGVPSGQTLGLAGGTISIGGGTLTAPNGAIRVTSVAGPGEIPVAPGNAATVTGHGTITIADQSTLDVSSPGGQGGGGSVFLRGGTITIDNSTLNADNFGAGPGGKIALRADGGVTLSGGTDIHADTFASGAAASIAVNTASLTINQALLESSSFGAGPGGNVTVNIAGNFTIDGGISLSTSGIETQTTLLSTGTPGNIAVTANALSVLNNATISSISSGTKGSGSVTVAAGTVDLDNGAKIAGDTLGSGLGGTVNVSANTLTMSNAAQISSVATGTGNAGNVVVTAGSASINSVAEIQASTTGPGNAGTVNVAVSGNLTILGPAANNLFFTGIGTVANPGATGNAGTVAVTAGSLSIGGFTGEISSSTLGAGNAGDVTVNVAGPVSITGPSGTFPTGIVAFARSDEGRLTGAAGTVRVTAGSLSIASGGQISSTTAGPGLGGDVVVSSPLIDLSGTGPQITAQSTGSGNAGMISVTAATVNMSGGASISTEALTANGGNIAISASDLLYLVDSQITTSVKGASGNGGNIAIDPSLFVLDHSRVIAQAVRGHGGNITIASDQFLPSDDSIVSASSQLGISGTVEVIGPRVDLNGSLVVLSSELHGAAAVLRTACEARGARPRSSLVEAGRGGLMQDVETTIPALYLADRDVEPAKQPATSAPMPAIGGLHTTALVTMGCS